MIIGRDFLCPFPVLFQVVVKIYRRSCHKNLDGEFKAIKESLKANNYCFFCIISLDAEIYRLCLYYCNFLLVFYVLVNVVIVYAINSEKFLHGAAHYLGLKK